MDNSEEKAEPAISVEKVSKVFKLPHERTSSIKGLFVGLFRRSKRGYEMQKALQNVSFEIQPGEFFGIVGRNGSGKSTLLKMLAGIYAPTKGKITINGKLTPFIELGVGFNPELTGRENVFLNGALLGFNRKEMNAMYNEIVEFAELERFMDQKLKNYSSGMQVRLAFSIAIRAKSDILLIDEVLAVGDTAFQRKCYSIFQQLKRDGQTVVFVSHSMADVERFCDRVLVVDKGNTLGIFSPHTARMKYEKLNQAETNSNPDPSPSRLGSGAIKIESVKLLSNNKPIKDALHPHDSMQIELKLKRHKKLDKNQKYVEIGIGITSEEGANVFGPNTRGKKTPIDAKKAVLNIPNLPLNRGTYYVTAALFDQDQVENYDLLDRVASFEVDSFGTHYGILDVDYEWKIDD